LSLGRMLSRLPEVLMALEAKELRQGEAARKDRHSSVQWERTLRSFMIGYSGKSPIPIYW
jgi:hypothetical protein